MLSWTRYHLLLVILMVTAGTVNTLAMKWANRIKSEGTDGTVRVFRHPYCQGIIMFAGEILCMILFKICYFHYSKKNLQDVRKLVRGNRNFTSWIFFLPAACDVLATSVMYVGLTLTYASSFQMLRGTLIVFVAMLSIGFLGRRIRPVEWIGMFFVVIGLLSVGLSDFLGRERNNLEGRDILIGDLLIVLSQVLTAIQIVLEEHFVIGRDIPPLQAVGLEGCFGISMLGILLVPLYYIRVGKPISTNPQGRLEDLNDAFTQIENQLLLLAPLSGIALSIAFLNFAGISITKEISGTSRTVLDSIRTFFIWGACLILGWQQFFLMQVFGFIIILIGLFIYHDILIPFVAKKMWDAIKAKSQKKSESLVEENAQ